MLTMAPERYFITIHNQYTKETNVLPESTIKLEQGSLVIEFVDGSATWFVGLTQSVFDITRRKPQDGDKFTYYDLKVTVINDNRWIAVKMLTEDNP